MVIESPMSFAGSAKRIMNMSNILLVQLAVLLPLVAVAWSLVIGWYAMFGILVIPYRLLRRSQRRNKRDAARHREMMQMTAAAVHASAKRF